MVQHLDLATRLSISSEMTLADLRNLKVEFRLIVFRPFKGEVIVGKIVGSDPHGIRSKSP